MCDEREKGRAQETRERERERGVREYARKKGEKHEQKKLCVLPVLVCVSVRR